MSEENLDMAIGQLLNAISFARNEIFLFKDTKRVKEYINIAEIWMNEIKEILNKASKEVNK